MVGEWLKSLLRREREGTMETPLDKHARFGLFYDNVHVGELSLEDGVWKFAYTEAFRKQTTLRPIVQFPDVNIVYRSRELWPFFGSRIPALGQQSVQRVLHEESIDEHDEVELLKRFGRRTISNPYELEVEA